MNFQISLALLLAASVISFQDKDGGDFKISRKHYGLSFHSKCRDYFKSFTCMTTCKSIGFQIFRMDFRCKCSCHRLKTTTILPFFKWRTNGTTKTLPKTHSPNLYHVAGTLSPARTETETTEETSINVTCPEPIETYDTTDDGSGNTTSVDGGSGATDAGNETTITDESDTGETSENMGEQTTDESETGADATTETGGSEDPDSGPTGSGDGEDTTTEEAETDSE